MMTMANAPNIDAIKRTVKSTAWMVFLGDIGDDSHQAGSGDHTTHSTHIGKYGYPTQGVVHAIDTGMTSADLGLAERFIRLSWMRGELTGIKYFNVINRHWNIQTWDNYKKAKAGTLQPRYSPDHHLHLSMENGDIDGDILDRFKRWKANGQQFDEQQEDDDMGMFLGPFEIPVEGVWTGPISPVQVGAANPRPGWINIGNDTFDVDYQVRLFVSSGNGGFGPLEKLGFLNRDGSSSVLQGQNGVFTLKSGVIYWDQLTKGTRIASIQRQGTYKGRLEFGVEYGEVER